MAEHKQVVQYLRRSPDNSSLTHTVKENLQASAGIAQGKAQFPDWQTGMHFIVQVPSHRAIALQRTF